MKQKHWNLLIGLVGLLLLVGCDKEIVEPESIDSEYDVRYYPKPPLGSETQGYLVPQVNSESQFVELASKNEPPFTLMVYARDKKGQETLEFIAQKEDSPIQHIEDKNPEQTNFPKSFVVQTTKYFETRYFYVSMAYKLASNSANNYGLSVLPFIAVQMNDGQDISTVEEKYKSVISLDQSAPTDNGVYRFNCKSKSSYEVLMIALDISSMIEVKSAEPELSNF